MNAINKTTGLPITGTLERLSGRGTVMEDSWTRTADGIDFDWGGETEVFWDEQRTVLREDGKRVFLDEDGNECTEDEIELVEEKA